jgi:hypothetical protein
LYEKSRRLRTVVSLPERSERPFSTSTASFGPIGIGAAGVITSCVLVSSSAASPPKVPRTGSYENKRSSSVSGFVSSSPRLPSTSVTRRTTETRTVAGSTGSEKAMTSGALGSVSTPASAPSMRGSGGPS